MKALVVIALVLAGIIVVAGILGLFIRKKYSVSREVLVNKPRMVVFEYIRFLKNQNAYSKWATMDPDMKTEFRGTDGGAGFVSAWDSTKKDVGKGEQEILKVTEGEKVEYEIRFLKPFESTSYASMSTSSVSDNETKIRWEFSAKMKYPMNLMLLFMNMEKMIGRDLETGLQNLKGILEKN